MKSGQASMETMIGVGLMTLLFLSILGLLNSLLNQEEKFSNEPDYFLDSFKQRIELMEQSENNVITYYEFPNDIREQDYTFEILNDSDRSLIYLYMTESTITRNLPVIINTTPIGSPGTYILTKNKTGLFIRK